MNSWAYSMDKTMRPKKNYNKNQEKSNPDKMSFSSMLIDRPASCVVNEVCLRRRALRQGSGAHG